MAGHSKWANIKHRKSAVDAKRGKIFTKLIKEITVASKTGGGDLASNPRLRRAVDTAKSNSMPGDNIDRAIKKGTGELEGVSYEEITYEAYGPSGVALIIESLTDNKNRTVAEVRFTLSKRGGNLGESGSVGWIFDRKGLISVDKKLANEEKLMEITLEAGAEDIADGGEVWEIYSDQANFDAVKEALDQAKIETSTAEISLIPQNTIDITDEESAQRILNLMDELEDLDDVQKVWANFDIPDEILDKIS